MQNTNDVVVGFEAVRTAKRYQREAKGWAKRAKRQLAKAEALRNESDLMAKADAVGVAEAYAEIADARAALGAAYQKLADAYLAARPIK